MLSPEYSNSSKIVPKLLKNIIFSFSFLFILNQSFIQIRMFTKNLISISYLKFTIKKMLNKKSIIWILFSSFVKYIPTIELMLRSMTVWIQNLIKTLQIKDLLIFSIVFFFKLHQIPLKVHSNDINPEIPIKIVMLEPEFIMIRFVE